MLYRDNTTLNRHRYFDSTMETKTNFDVMKISGKIYERNIVMWRYSHYVEFYIDLCKTKFIEPLSEDNLPLLIIVGFN